MDTPATETRCDDEALAEIVYKCARSEQEVEAVKALLGRLDDIKADPYNSRHVHPFTLIRFLRARDLDLNQAESMFRSSMEWRKAERIGERKHFCLCPLEPLLPFSCSSA